MERRGFLRLVTATTAGGLVSLSGCINGNNDGEDGSDGEDGGDGNGGDGGNGTNPEYDVYVFDGGMENSVIEGGLKYPDEDYKTRTFATLVRNKEEAERFNTSVLERESGGKPLEFVKLTDFTSSYILVIQVFPMSSVPDFEVKSLKKEGDTLNVRMERPTGGGTDDITIETVFVRIHDEPIESATITAIDFDTVYSFNTTKLSSKKLPQIPESVTKDNIVGFVEEFETAYKWNQEVGPDVTDISINPVRSSVQDETQDGFIIHLEVAISKCSMDDGTKVEADGFYTVNYYVTPEVVKRAQTGGQQRPGPDPRNGVVVRNE